jgi:hypothetical protein
MVNLHRLQPYKHQGKKEWMEEEQKKSRMVH